MLFLLCILGFDDFVGVAGEVTSLHSSIFLARGTIIFDIHFVNVSMVSNDRLLPDHAEQGAPEGAIPFAAEQLLEVNKGDDIDKKTGISIGVEFEIRNEPTCH